MEINGFEFDLFKHTKGDASGQQTWEALAILVGLKLFSMHWQKSRAVLEVRSDNLTALSMTLCMKGKGFGVNLVARALALGLADGAFRPEVVKHVSGASNVVADILSRKFQPDKEFVLPQILRKVEEFHPPSRDASCYRAISGLPAEQSRKFGQDPQLPSNDH